jgi:hypothetical protein
MAAVDTASIRASSAFTDAARLEASLSAVSRASKSPRFATALVRLTFSPSASASCRERRRLSSLRPSAVDCSRSFSSTI